ncbi:helix-turn-helix transcriptional regulator [Flavivirga jejuensis]|uniref:AraC family transcriptional regulator n=1 Tax=Flavivirga jejuensis TaxID=870487 RepID=A0ABT8WT21_9FLAO|nr:AraC family transcriptional regulator [Flavivirga jejuensis]MDO5976119.1 AraC family transcriptional regulator [Flavivirga jejuensis]
MISSFKIKNYHKEAVLTEYQPDLKNEMIDEVKTSLNTHFSKSKNKEILLDGVIINMRKDYLSSPILLEVAHDFPYLKVHFEIEGKLEYIPDNKNEMSITINNGSYNFFYLPKPKGVISLKSKKRKEFSILVTEDYLRKSFKHYFEKKDASFIKSLKKKTSYKLFPESKVIPVDLLLIISDIINCSFQKEIKQVYLESKVKELFSYLFSEMDSQTTEKKEIKLNEIEYNQVVKSEKILQKNIHKTITISDLSQLIGVNEYKLKRNFKIVYKKPVFRYFTDLRMEKAKQMLVKNNVDVSDVAVAVGYKNPQHFTVAFKKKYNYVPSKLRNKVKNL